MQHLTRVLLILLLVQWSNSHPRAAEPSKISFGFSSIGAAGTGVWMAKEIGAFEKYGLTADVIYISSGPVVLQALIGGDLTVGLGASNSTVAAALRGLRSSPSAASSIKPTTGSSCSLTSTASRICAARLWE
jgi:ABC-type nitrate/sulfonate/bicarbonate transport system substrate-binding protein